MKFLLPLLTTLFFNFSVHADDGGMGLLFVAGAIGGSAAVGGNAAVGRLPEELQDWQDPKIQSTSQLEAQCGLLTEVKLVRTSRLNLLFIGVQNQGAEDASLMLDRIRLRFGNGRERFALANNRRSEEVKKGWYSWGFVALPRKSDFRGQEELKVFVPVLSGGKTCEIENTFHRDLAKPEDENSVTEASSLLVSFGISGIGGPYGRTQDVLGTGGTSFDISFAGFSAPSQGWFLTFSLLNLDKVKDPSYFGSGPYTQARGADLSLGKAYRYFRSEVTTDIWSLGLSGTSITGTNGKTGSDLQNSPGKSGYGFYTSYTRSWRYAREYFGVFRGDYEVGLTAYAKYYPLFDNGSKDLGFVGLGLEFFRVGD